MASVDNMTSASFGSSTFARYLTRPAAPTIPKARARLEPTTSIATAPDDRENNLRLNDRRPSRRRMEAGRRDRKPQEQGRHVA
ncbi:MAG TPA: hypothetical protein VF219_20510 [Vicinamibacterales bacterium]